MAKLIVEWSENEFPGVKLHPDNDWSGLHIIERIDFYKDLIELAGKNLEELEIELVRKRRLKWLEFK